MNCVECNKELLPKNQKTFCGHSCAATFNNNKRNRKREVICSVCNVGFMLPNWIQRVNYVCSTCPKKSKLPIEFKPNIKSCRVCSSEFISINNFAFCSNECRQQRRKKYSKTCQKCSILYKAEKINSKFCSGSCRSVSLNLHVYAHKRSGLSRSKIEEYVESCLVKDFPNLKIIFNDKQTIGSELDIYLPDLRMAFELNGVFHYLPIYGENTLQKTQNRDKQKTIKCYKLGIKFITINLGNCGFSKRYAKDMYKQIYDLIIFNKDREWAV